MDDRDRADLLYAYCLVRPEDADRPEGSGLDGTRLRTVRCGRVAVVVADVTRARFGKAQWLRHAEDPAWLAAMAQSHHQVLDALARQLDLLPLRMPAVYDDEASLRAAVDGHGELFAASLERLRGKVEWGVKIYDGEPPGRATDTTAELSATSGRDYLSMRAAESSRRAAAARERADLARRCHETLRATSYAAVVNKPQARRISGHRGVMLLNAAYLLPRSGAAGFHETVREVDRSMCVPAGARLELTGPWPPYNFGAETP